MSHNEPYVLMGPGHNMTTTVTIDGSRWTPKPKQISHEGEDNERVEGSEALSTAR